MSDISNNDSIIVSNFVRDIIKDDIKNNKNDGKVITRFPPEPNGYLHIGHAKAFCLNFGLAEEFGGRYHLRFDDTNPIKEEAEYIESIKQDIRWMGFDWGEYLYYASDYFDQLYEYAIHLIKDGMAYICDLSPDQTREYRGTLTKPGKNSPYRNRSVEENLGLFEKMKGGEIDEGTCVLRAKINMTSPNLNMRDPIMYRILKAEHHSTGNKWCIYPTYDFTHGQSDSIEGITHSICDISFEDHRPLYDWFIEQLGIHHPQQIEFARLNITYTILSKRKLKKLVDQGFVSGWDDPRMPTLSGLRRRGYTPESIKIFLNKIGVAKNPSIVDIALLEHCLRDELNKKAQRIMAVLKPLKIIIDNYPEGKVEELEADNNQEDPSMGKRKICFSRELYIEQEDFREDPPKKYFRLAPGREIRLKHAYYIKCEDFVKDPATGEIIEVHCTYDPETRGGWSKDGRKVKGTSHWVSGNHAVKATVCIYNHLFTKPYPEDNEDGEDFTNFINPDSLEVLSDCLIENNFAKAKPGDCFQFLRQGYFCVDSIKIDGTLIFNRTVSLKDTWAKIEKKQK